MKVSVHALPTLVPLATCGPAVVIDVLRATSVMITALASGARAVRPVAEIEEARALSATLPPGTALCGGERRALPIPGFPLGNSPLEYTSEKVAGKTIILTTTNGTRALAALRHVEPLFIGAFLNAGAVAHTLAELGQDCQVVCSGTRGRFSLDDVACAGLIVARLQAEVPDLTLDDLAYAALFLYQAHQDDLRGLIRHADHYQYLLSIGLEPDIAYCLQQDVFSLVPRVVAGEVVV
ncbi:MAG TPA: 2-phosphosulfolactate phosphatase [Firmicutes bacterium]|nr:2-phosphosulfolactate phosphatase [Bacillota bacterium]